MVQQIVLFFILFAHVSIVLPMDSVDRTELLKEFLQQEGVKKFITCAETYPLTICEYNSTAHAELLPYALWNLSKKYDQNTEQRLLHIVETKLYYLALTYLKNSSNIPNYEKPELAKYLANRTVDELWQIKRKRELIEAEKQQKEQMLSIKKLLTTKSKSFDSSSTVVAQPEPLVFGQNLHHSISYDTYPLLLHQKPSKISNTLLNQLSYVKFSANKELVFVAFATNIAKIWDVTTGNILVALHFNRKIIGAYFSNDNRFIILFLSDGTISIWSINKNRLIKTFNLQQFCSNEKNHMGAL